MLRARTFSHTSRILCAAILALFDFIRPVLLTGIEELAVRGDLLDRSLLIYLPTISEQDRQDDAPGTLLALVEPGRQREQGREHDDRGNDPSEQEHEREKSDAHRRRAVLQQPAPAQARPLRLRGGGPGQPYHSSSGAGRDGYPRLIRLSQWSRSSMLGA